MASMTPDFLSKILFWKKSRSRDLEQENISNELNKWEDCVNRIQKILIWDDPVISSLSIIAVNLLFWLLIHFECKFYGLVFTVLLTLTLHQLWVEHIQPDLKISERSMTVRSDSGNSSNTRLLTMAEISRYASKAQEMAKNSCFKLRRLRQDQPGTFCVVTCICFLFLSVIGRSISGIELLYTFIIMIMIVPGACIHFLPPHFVNSFTNMFNSSHRDNENENDNEVDEYLPETSGETLALLNLAGELQLTPREDDEDSNDILLEQMSARTNDTAESSCSKLSFCPDASMMPSHENSLDFLDFDRLTSESKKSDSNDSEFSDIHFQSRHFNGDSSDEEDEFSKGLEFRHSDKNKRPTEENKSESAPSFLSAANVGRNIISMGANILTHVVKQQTELKRNDRESSSDTDSFELISGEDM